MKIILHIGQAKTGSSSIQRFLFHNKDVLIDKGYYYNSDTKYEMNDNELYPYSHTDIIRKFQNDYVQMKNIFDGMINDAKNRNLDSVIISSEWIWDLFKIEEIEKFINIFDYPVHVVVYLRRVDILIESLWQQWYFFDYDSFDKYIKDEPYKHFLNYYEIVKNWEKYAKQLTITPFEKRYFKNGLENNFLSILGINKNDDFKYNHIDNDEGWGANRGLNPKALNNIIMKNKNLLSKYKDRYLLHRFIKSYLGDIFEKEHGESYNFFTYEKRMEILKQYQPIIDNIAKDFFEGNTNLFETPKPYNSEVEDEINMDTILKSLLNIGVKQDKMIKNLKEKMEILEKKLSSKE